MPAARKERIWSLVRVSQRQLLEMYDFFVGGLETPYPAAFALRGLCNCKPRQQRIGRLSSNIGSALCGTDANYRSTKVSVFSASINNEEGQRYALAKFEPGVTLWWAYAVTTSSRDARERSIELAGSI